MKAIKKDPRLQIADAPRTTRSLIQFLNNGNRLEIALETPKQKQAFFDFVALAIQDLDQDIQQRTLAYLDSMTRSRLKSFCRYFYEGWLKTQSTENNSYHSEGLNLEVLKKILYANSFTGLKGADFGFGNGEVVHLLSQAGAEMTGYELSPFMVQNMRNLGISSFMAKIDQEPNQFKKEFCIEPQSLDFVIATLVLDRLEKPRNFIQNFLGSLTPGGVFALQTLLPIIPKDDGPVQDPIIYTSPENSITPGKTSEGDMISLTEILGQYFGEVTQIIELCYSVGSLDGTQKYVLWSFSGRKIK